MKIFLIYIISLLAGSFSLQSFASTSAIGQNANVFNSTNSNNGEIENIGCKTQPTSQSASAQAGSRGVFYALFYGVIIAFSVYNILIFLSIRNSVYLLYICHIMFIGSFALTQDRLGSQLLWPEPYNKTIVASSLFLMTVSGFLLARKFLGTVRFPVIEKLLLGLIAARTIAFLLGLTLFPSLNQQTTDLAFYLALYGIGFLAWVKGYIPARFYVLAFSIFFLGFTVNTLYALELPPIKLLPEYSFHIAVLLNLILVSYAFADKIKYIIAEREAARKETIKQLKENETLKDQTNTQLEKMVQERTKELEDKNKQLDVFVYKASHDMKGPLRSIIGLTDIGLKDIQDPQARLYLEHIKKSTRRLDNTLKDLIQLARVKETSIERKKVKVYDIFTEILESLEHLPEYTNITITLNFNRSVEVNTDKKLLYSILQNLTENAIKYQDPKKEDAFLSVTINESQNETEIVFEDNGRGIEQEMQQQVFEMFFKANEQSSGTGLGLYIVKTSVEKLKGSVYLQSVPSQGSTFTVKLPN
ncbi:sensor histidine kinase [Cytophagaceae bacterium ABcell3]|nr:sensor histidine kinase [Cytophagaceae bacterium ABcell3]